GMEFIGKVSAEIVHTIVSAGVARLGIRKERPAEKKIGECSAGNRAGPIAEREDTLPKILHQIEEAVTPHVRAEFPGVPATDPRHVIGELEHVVLADLRLEDVAIAHVRVAGNVNGGDAIVCRPWSASDSQRLQESAVNVLSFLSPE